MVTTRVAWLAVIAIATTVASVPASVNSAYQKMDALDENYLTGYLWWSQGRGGISWTSDPPSEDDVDAGNNSNGAWNDFVSEPVPRTLYLNVSRVVQLHLLLKEVGIFGVKFELYVGYDFLTGGTSSNANIHFCEKPTDTNCVDPSVQPRAAGYLSKSQGTQAELDTVPKGAVLRLRIIHTSANPVVYGLAGDHASILRLPVFSGDEVLYRVPKFQPDAPGETDSVLPPVERTLVEELQRVVAGVGLTLAPIGFRRARDRNVILLTALLTAGALAGCVSNSEPAGPAPTGGPALAGSASSYIVRDNENETGLLGDGDGSIAGVVLDPDDGPVGGASIAVLRTSHFTRSDPYGRFHFKGLEAGDYRLRIDRNGFKSFETDTNVEAGSITRMEVYLEFVNVSARDQRPHRHDTWFDTSGKPVDSIVLYDGVGDYFTVPPPLIVPPGTGDVEIIPTWDNGDGLATIRIYDGMPNGPGNETNLYPRPKGTPVHLRTTWEMMDPGHPKYSYWGTIVFNFIGRCREVAPGFPDLGCSFLPLERRLKIIAHKGVLPLEPAHPDRWQGSDVVTVLDDQPATLKRYCAGQDFGGGIQASLCPFSTSDPTKTNSDKMYNASWRASYFVPYESQWVDIQLKADRDLTTDTSEIPWTVSYHDARTRAPTGCSPRPTGGVYKIGESERATFVKADPANRQWTYRILLKPGQTDPPYAPFTQWCFFAAPTNSNAALLEDYRSQATLGSLPTLRLTASAHRDPAPT